MFWKNKNERKELMNKEKKDKGVTENRSWNMRRMRKIKGDAKLEG